MSWATPAKGHMPFPGHRTCAEWDRPAVAHQEASKRPPAPIRKPTPICRPVVTDKGPDLKALTQLVAERAALYGITVDRLRSPSKDYHLVAARLLTAREAKRKGYTCSEIGWALGRTAGSIRRLIHEGGEA